MDTVRSAARLIPVNAKKNMKSILVYFAASKGRNRDYDSKEYYSTHNVVDRGVGLLQVMWEKLAGQVVHRVQLIIF